MTITIDSAPGAVSELLSEITIKLQLDDTRYGRAEQAYRGVGGYLEKNAPERAWLRIDPQGSMRLQTTVKPRGRIEHDLDIVATLIGAPPGMTARELYNWGLRLLLSNETYKKIIEPKNRCVRLNYAGDFHLDVLFAVLDPSLLTDSTSILVPDRKLEDFVPSNPIGYAAWFDRQCEVDSLLVKRQVAMKQAPLPSNDPAHLKALLKRIVQLMKRARDVRFDGSDAAPRSVVLTTLAARTYLGAAALHEGLVATLENIALEIENAHGLGARLEVRNPTNQLEDFSETWDAKPDDYRQAVEWLGELRDRVCALPNLKGQRLTGELERLFGETVVREAQLAIAERVRKESAAGRLRTTGRSLTTAAGVGAPVRPHGFFGADDGSA